VSAAHDLAEGGLAVALAEMALAGGMGATLNVTPAVPLHGFLFGEDQSRYLLTASPEQAEAIAAAARAEGVACAIIGTTGGDKLTIPGEAAIFLEDLKRRHQQWLPGFMRGAHG
jgi:phosphoribosylformylglycinamidine synthase